MTDDSPNSRLALLKDPGNWSLCYHTAVNMHARQLGGIVDRSLRHLLVPRLPVDFDARYERRVPDDLTVRPEPIRTNTDTLRQVQPEKRSATYRQRIDDAMAGNLTFLDTTIDVGAEAPDWFHPAVEDQPFLWSLKFRGFAFLEWPVFSTETPAERPELHRTFSRWIRHWAHSETTDVGTAKYLRRCWTPHSVSLRILNWCRYYAWCESTTSEAAFLTMLRHHIFKNALFLEKHVEHEIGGNHLIENAVALVMAGVMFDDHETGWVEQGLDILASANDQFLADGGHFERSPMYHVIALERYLTVIDLLERSGRRCPEQIQRTARRATGFLESIRPPDGRIPLLNDSVYGESLGLDPCLEYAHVIDITSNLPRQNGLSASGYYWLGSGSDRMLVDGGPFGPPALPAHSHNDFFSILLWLDGSPVLTDTGTTEYAPTARRQYARSVRAHSTVQVGTTEPVELGGQFLAGKRVSPQVRFVEGDDVTVFDGTYTKKRQGRGGYTHRRRIFETGESWLVQDDVSDTGDRPLRSRLHLHPDVTPTISGEKRVTLPIDGTECAHLLALGVADVTRTTSPYFPEFGIERTRPSLLLETAPGNNTIGFLLSKQPIETTRYHDIVSKIRSTEHGYLDTPTSIRSDIKQTR